VSEGPLGRSDTGVKILYLTLALAITCRVFRLTVYRRCSLTCIRHRAPQLVTMHYGPLPVNCSVPQGSVLGPIKFIAYTEDVSELIAQHGVSYHLFADDKQLYTAVSSDEIHVARQRLTSCISVLRDWCASRRLQLNA